MSKLLPSAGQDFGHSDPRKIIPEEAEELAYQTTVEQPCLAPARCGSGVKLIRGKLAQVASQEGPSGKRAGKRRVHLEFNHSFPIGQTLGKARRGKG